MLYWSILISEYSTQAPTQVHEFCKHLYDLLSTVPSPLLGFKISHDLYTVWKENLCSNLDNFENESGNWQKMWGLGVHM